MTDFGGVPIGEYILCVHLCIFILLFLAGIFIFGFWLYLMIDGRDVNLKKRRERVGRLKERAATDEDARAKLGKLERKTERRAKKGRRGLIGKLTIGVLAILMCAFCLFFGVLPPLCDYATKDYVVYTGEITVSYSVRSHFIFLPDGTRLYGSGVFSQGDTYGTVVYGRNSKLVIGSQK